MDGKVPHEQRTESLQRLLNSMVFVIGGEIARGLLSYDRPSLLLLWSRKSLKITDLSLHILLRRDHVELVKSVEVVLL